MRILLVDDKDDSLRLLQQVLIASGHEVTAVSNGSEALNALYVQPCDLIISDILMPIMDGFQFCKNVKANHQFNTIPFIFYTATYTDKKDEEFALALGAERFIRKPAEPEDFLQILQELSDGMASRRKPEPLQKTESLEETEVLKLYSERLVNKLEKKMLDLEREVTERKRAEETQAKLAKILEISLNELYVFDAETLRFMEVNRGARSNLGYTLDELHQLTPLHIMAEFNRESLSEMLNSLKSGEQQHIQLLTNHQRKDGSTYPVEVHLEYAISHPFPVFIAIVLDVTERNQGQEALRQAEVQLYQLQKMEALGTLSAGIAHDFNNILSAIIGYTELALIKVSTQAEISQVLQQVLTAGYRAKDLVKHILTFSRQVEQQRKPIQLHIVVREALTMLRATLPSTIEIRQSLTPVSGTVLADATQIHQVLMNLCTNAEHAMREKGGVLEVGLEAVEMTEKDVTARYELKPGPYVRLSVRDTGQGMSLEVQSRIFEPFFTTKDVDEGTGMGLAVVHGIIASHDGVISVDSVPDRGTTFEIYLPQIDATVDAEVYQSLPIQPRRARILFVDDEEALTQLGQKMLEQLGHEAVVHTNSIQALQVFRADPDRYDVVITDQTMPRLTGEMLAHDLLSIRPKLPIILCTGFSHIMTPEKARAMGIQAYLIKPILIHELALILQQVLEPRPE